jgi:hypothetical protein
VQVEENSVRSRERMMDRGLYGIGDGVIGLPDGSSVTPGREPGYNKQESSLEFIAFF